MNNLPEQAAQQWRELMRLFQNGETVLSGVLAEYSQPSRHYHNVQHIAETTERVANLIMATKKHQPLNDSADMFLFLDADLSILGSDQKHYEEYASAIRREYAHIWDSAYREGRIAVLKKFLQRPRLYFSEYAHARLEERARQNISAEVQRLERAAVHGVG